MQRLLSVQLLRALAALMVVIFHISGATALVGAAGVDIFFVISGLVMWIVTDLPNTRPSTFAFDRLARILPLYWICTLAIATASLIVPTIFPSLRVSAGWLVASILLVPSYEPGTSHIWPILAQGWTLTYEMLFYAILLTAQFLIKSQRKIFVSVVIFALVLVGSTLPLESARATVYTNPLLLEFLAGYWLGSLATANLLPRTGGRYALLALGLGGFVISLINGFDPTGWLRLLQWGLPALALVAAAISLEEDVAKLARLPFASSLLKLGAILGDASYAIYLTHGFAISIMHKIWNMLKLPQPHSADIGFGLETLHFLVAIVACTLLGVAVHFTLERWLVQKFRPYRPNSEMLAMAA